MYKSQFQGNYPYEWFYGPGSQMLTWAAETRPQVNFPKTHAWIPKCIGHFGYAKWTKVPSAGCQAVRSSEVCDRRTALLPVNATNIVNTNNQSNDLKFSLCVCVLFQFNSYLLIQWLAVVFYLDEGNTNITITIQTPSLSMNMIAPSMLTLLSLSTFGDEEVWLRIFFNT